jgi:hypothetical protein
MKTQAKSAGLLCLLLITLASAPLHAQFQQLTAGAVSSAPGSPLTFVNGAIFDVSSGFSQTLVYTVVTNFVLTNIIYSTTNLQIWSLPSTNAGSSAIGSYIVGEVVSVTGPSGGVLSLWEQGWRIPTYSFPVGVAPVAGSNRFDVSDIALSAGLPDGDPVGRIPLRRFTVNQPGDYLLTLKLLDVSTNTAAGGPKHTPSESITIKFSTGLDLALTRILRNTNGVETVTFKQSALTNVFVEANTNLSVNEWVAVAGPFTNAPALNNTTTMNFTNPGIASRYFRLRGVAP